MALPTSGEISFQQFGTEFGDSGEISMNNMYRGGAFVDATTETPYSFFQGIGEYDGPYVDINWGYYSKAGQSGELYWDGSFLAYATNNFYSWTAFLGFFEYLVDFQPSVPFDGGTFRAISRRPAELVSGVTVTQVNTQVPTAGTIGMQNMRGAQNY